MAPATAVQIGAGTARIQDVRVGDAVTVRAYRSGSALIATRVHVQAASRQNRSIQATVVSVGPGTLTVLDRGKRYVVAVGPAVAVTLNGNRVALSALRPGDRIKLLVRGTAAPLPALQAAATRKAPKPVTVSGTIGQVTAGGLVIVDGAGTRHLVRLAPGVRPLLHGSAAPASALFPGVHARARGTVSGGALIASSITVTVTSRTVHGRVSTAATSYLVLAESAGKQVRADLLPGEYASDGKTRLAPGSLRAGVYLQVTGWVEAVDRLRATALAVQHPNVSLAATVVSITDGLTISTSAGTRYRLRFSGSSQIVASRVQVSLTQADIPVGTRVHVDGSVDASGRLLVTSMTVRLNSVTLQGQVTEAVLNWTVKTGAATYALRVQADTPVVQGTHALTLDDIVPGDSVTVYGYSLAQSTVLVRKIQVHRKLKTLDGTVAALNPDGFVLQSADGQHRVITSVSTVLSGVGTTVAVGQSVHVTGYLRGDGVVLATRVRIVKAAPIAALAVSPRPTLNLAFG
jgi:hypothetical protein